MNLKKLFKALYIFSIFIGIYSCNEKQNAKNDEIEKVTAKKISVFNYDNKTQLAEYNSLNLDANHPNLLNPEISKSDLNTVRKSWTDFHQKIGKALSENEFKWNVTDSVITIVHKFYFNSQGEIENYFFKVLNENVTSKKKKEFADIISAFADTNKIDFTSDSKFAQCGKTKYLNK